MFRILETQLVSASAAGGSGGSGGSGETLLLADEDSRLADIMEAGSWSSMDSEPLAGHHYYQHITILTSNNTDVFLTIVFKLQVRPARGRCARARRAACPPCSGRAPCPRPGPSAATRRTPGAGTTQGMRQIIHLNNNSIFSNFMY